MLFLISESKQYKSQGLSQLSIYNFVKFRGNIKKAKPETNKQTKHDENMISSKYSFKESSGFL